MQQRTWLEFLDDDALAAELAKQFGGNKKTIILWLQSKHHFSISSCPFHCIGCTRTMKLIHESNNEYRVVPDEVKNVRECKLEKVFGGSFNPIEAVNNWNDAVGDIYACKREPAITPQSLR